MPDFSAHAFLQPALLVGSLCLGTLAFTGLLHLIPRLGAPGKALARSLAHAPLLDMVVFILTTMPQIVGVVLGVRWWTLPLRGHLIERCAALAPWMAGVLGLLAGVLAQCLALLVWMRLHELAHARAMQGPRIKTALNAALGGGPGGAWRNYLAVWWTMLAVPIFTFIRLGELIIYPPLIRLIGLPKYHQAQWVNVSRHKFDGLVGADRVWCLYCDWMTGVWSLGSEMLRNIESFWCPIRFASPEKCENCTLDFPDVSGSWVPHDATMKDVDALVRSKYPGPGGVNSWHGHESRGRKTTRVTVKGERVNEAGHNA